MASTACSLPRGLSLRRSRSITAASYASRRSRAPASALPVLLRAEAAARQHYMIFAGLQSAGNLYLHPVSRGSTVVCSMMDTPKSKQGPDHLLILVHGIMARVAPTVDADLLSYPDMMHLGALPYAMKHLGLSAPVYATEPVFRLGILTMYDHFLSRWKQRKVEASRSDGAADSAVVLVLPTTRSRRVSVVNAAMVDHDDSQLSFYSCHSLFQFG